MQQTKKHRGGLTLTELIVVLVILIALAGILVPLLPSVSNNAKGTTTLANMQTIRSAINAYALDMRGIGVNPAGYASNVSSLAFGTQGNTTGWPLALKDLVVAPKDMNGNTIGYDPVARRGWRGPYLTGVIGKFNYNTTFGLVLDSSFKAYGAQDDAAVLDGYSRPIVVQWVTADTTGTWVRLVSAGSNGVLDTPMATTDLSTTAPAWATAKDDTVIYLGKPLSFSPALQ